MKLAILGATGRIGSHLQSWALDTGHSVRALARHPEALRPAPGPAVIGGNALDAGAVAEVIAGTDAVLSALAPRGKKNPGLLAGAAANMVAAMEETGPRRLICVSAGGPWVRDDPNVNWLIKLVLPRVLATTFADIRGMEDTIRASGLDWTLVRASQLTDGPLTRHYRVAPDFTSRGGRKISRADLAHFIEATLTDGGWLKSAPALAY